MKKKFGSGKTYADVLTILLVIIIIAIIALLGFVAFRVINKNHVEQVASNANQNFLDAAEENRKHLSNKNNTTESPNTTIDSDRSGIDGIIQNSDSSQTATGGNSTNDDDDIKKEYLGNYEIKGSISIPKTSCNYPILEKVTPDSLSKSVAIMEISANPELNRTVKDLNVPGTNAYIMGHNYRNGQFFSNNDKLSIGDKIIITDQLGNEVTYIIYHMEYVEPDDASFMLRDIDINTREISIQTCNDDSSKRLIIFAADKEL